MPAADCPLQLHHAVPLRSPHPPLTPSGRPSRTACIGYGSAQKYCFSAVQRLESVFSWLQQICKFCVQNCGICQTQARVIPIMRDARPQGLSGGCAMAHVTAGEAPACADRSCDGHDRIRLRSQTCTLAAIHFLLRCTWQASRCRHLCDEMQQVGAHKHKAAKGAILLTLGNLLPFGHMAAWQSWQSAAPPWAAFVRHPREAKSEWPVAQQEETNEFAGTAGKVACMSQAWLYAWQV